MIALWMFLTLSVLQLALAAPVVVGEIREVVLRDEMTTWEKRMDTNDDAPGNNIDAEGIKERALGQWVWPGEWEQDPSDINPPRVGSSVGGSKSNGNGGGNAMQSSQKLAENTRPAPQSERPATSGLMTFLKNWFAESAQPLKVFRPRNYASGPAGMPRELQGTVDSNAYVSDSSLLLQTTQVTNILTPISMFRARATSASSAHDLPVRHQWIPDQLD